MKILPRSKKKVSVDLIEKLKKIEPAEIGHTLHFGFMDPRIKSKLSDVKVVGQAFTIKITANDSTMVHKGVSLAKEGDVLVIDRAGDTKHACVGEIVAYAAKINKLSGIIIDGPCTDIQAIKELGIPVFATGLSPITTKLVGNSGEINTTVQCGGVCVNPGDVILADDNGVLVLPIDTIDELTDVIDSASKGEAGEVILKKKLDNGESLASLTNADNLLRKNNII